METGFQTTKVSINIVLTHLYVDRFKSLHNSGRFLN